MMPGQIVGVTAAVAPIKLFAAARGTGETGVAETGESWGSDRSPAAKQVQWGPQPGHGYPANEADRDGGVDGADRGT